LLDVTITNITVCNFEIYQSNLMLRSVLVENMHKNGSLNCIIVNLYFLLTSQFTV